MADLKKLYDDVIMDHIKRARNYGEMPLASARAEAAAEDGQAGGEGHV